MIWSDENIGADQQAIVKRLVSSGRLPRHVAIIMDGNGRWALARSLPRIEGHKEGMESVRSAVKTCSQLGVNYLTLYAFSMENWRRPGLEVSFLMRLLETYLKRELDELHANNVRITMIGKMNALPKYVQRVLRSAIEKTSVNEGLTLTLALSYGARFDITRAVQMIALDVRRGQVSPEDITEELIGSYLHTNGTPDPDLMIRTSGELRLSNFLLWEIAYAEIYVTDTLWPDFRRIELIQALTDYVCRERRFGKTSQQINSTDASAGDISTLQQIINAFR